MAAPECKHQQMTGDKSYILKASMDKIDDTYLQKNVRAISFPLFYERNKWA